MKCTIVDIFSEIMYPNFSLSFQLGPVPGRLANARRANRRPQSARQVHTFRLWFGWIRLFGLIGLNFSRLIIGDHVAIELHDLHDTCECDCDKFVMVS